MVLDAGPTSGGLESTVLDLTVDPPRLLRPGLITSTSLQAVVGRVAGSPASQSADEPLRSPGLLERHYAPKARLICCADSSDLIKQALAEVNCVGWLRFVGYGERPTEVVADNLRIIEMPADAAQYSRRLYAALHELDDAGVAQIIVDLPPNTAEWLAVHDRLRRASANPDSSAALGDL
jgi:L-threonylcarbamoyladenylate synthase